MKLQNKSSAVMQQRIEPQDSLDDYPTPPWATRALCEYVLPYIYPAPQLKALTVWEPAANRGYMVRPLQEYFGRVVASDIADYGFPLEYVLDFTDDDKVRQKFITVEFDAVITNPPFRLAEAFIHRAFRSRNIKFCAFFVRSSFLEGKGRYANIFKDYPPTIFAPFVERVPLVKGRYDKKISSATSYCWLIWRAENTSPTRIVWIPPCRKVLEKEED